MVSLSHDFLWKRLLNFHVVYDTCTVLHTAEAKWSTFAPEHLLAQKWSYRLCDEDAAMRSSTWHDITSFLTGPAGISAAWLAATIITLSYAFEFMKPQGNLFLPSHSPDQHLFVCFFVFSSWCKCVTFSSRVTSLSLLIVFRMKAVLSSSSGMNSLLTSDFQFGMSGAQ